MLNLEVQLLNNLIGKYILITTDNHHFEGYLLNFDVNYLIIYDKKRKKVILINKKFILEILPNLNDNISINTDKIPKNEVEFLNYCLNKEVVVKFPNNFMDSIVTIEKYDKNILLLKENAIYYKNYIVAIEVE